MLVQIPYGNTTLDCDLTCEVVATGGPPGPTFGVNVIRWQFIKRWHYDEEEICVLDMIDDYIAFSPSFEGRTDRALCEVVTPYDRFVAEWLADNYEEIREKWGHEVDNMDGVW